MGQSKQISKITIISTRVYMPNSVQYLNLNECGGQLELDSRTLSDSTALYSFLLLSISSRRAWVASAADVVLQHSTAAQLSTSILRGRHWNVGAETWYRTSDNEV